MNDLNRPTTSPSRWAAALWLGLVTSSFSTAVASLGAERLGRSPAVDWMVVSSLVLRDAAWQADPGWGVILAGVAVHQSADVWWACVFFGMLGRWTTNRSPAALLALALPWAALTSALEWLVFVPLLPFRQPAFSLEQPYWLGLVVHGLSALLYPLYPAVDDLVRGRRPLRDGRFARAWVGAASAVVLVLGVGAAFGTRDIELPHGGRDAEADQAFLRRMSEHHAQGVRMATLAQTLAGDDHLRGLARLMVASQTRESRVFGRWWRSWFGDPAALVCSEQERAAMPGMLGEAELAALANLRGAAFDARFVEAMSFHHRGAIQMADRAAASPGDLRVRFMAQAIRHQQRGEIALMHGVDGSPAVRLAALAMLAPAGSHPADTPSGGVKFWR